jgi:anti-anti-sigma factor
MKRRELEVRTEEQEGVPLIRVEGEVHLRTVNLLRTAASRAVRRRPEKVIFDLRRVTYIDSSGLQILIAVRKQLNNDPEAVVVITDQPGVLQALRITGLDRVLRVLSGEQVGTTDEHR